MVDISHSFFHEGRARRSPPHLARRGVALELLAPPEHLGDEATEGGYRWLPRAGREALRRDKLHELEDKGTPPGGAALSPVSIQKSKSPTW